MCLLSEGVTFTIDSLGLGTPRRSPSKHLSEEGTGWGFLESNANWVKIGQQ